MIESVKSVVQVHVHVHVHVRIPWERVVQTGQIRPFALVGLAAGSLMKKQIAVQ